VFIEDLLLGHSRTQPSENVPERNAQPRMHGFPPRPA
jgi:hypothetical protein